MMDSIFILGTALLAYIFVVVKISLYVKKKYIWQGDNQLINNTAKWIFFFNRKCFSNKAHWNCDHYLEYYYTT